MKIWLWRMFCEPMLRRLERQRLNDMELLNSRLNFLLHDLEQKHLELLVTLDAVRNEQARQARLLEPVAPRLRAGVRPPALDWDETQRQNLKQFEENV